MTFSEIDKLDKMDRQFIEAVEAWDPAKESSNVKHGTTQTEATGQEAVNKDTSNKQKPTKTAQKSVGGDPKSNSTVKKSPKTPTKKRLATSYQKVDSGKRSERQAVTRTPQPQTIADDTRTGDASVRMHLLLEQVPSVPTKRIPRRFAYQFWADQVVRLNRLANVLNMLRDAEEPEIRLSDMARQAFDDYIDNQIRQLKKEPDPNA